MSYPLAWAIVLFGDGAWSCLWSNSYSPRYFFGDLTKYERNVGMEDRKRSVTVQQVKNALIQKGKNYSDEEVKAILDFLYRIGEIEYQHFIKNKENEEKSDSLYQSVLRRPG